MKQRFKEEPVGLSVTGNHMAIQKIAVERNNPTGRRKLTKTENILPQLWERSFINDSPSTNI